MQQFSIIDFKTHYITIVTSIQPTHKIIKEKELNKNHYDKRSNSKMDNNKVINWYVNFGLQWKKTPNHKYIIYLVVQRIDRQNTGPHSNMYTDVSKTDERVDFAEISE